jgi:hypothetical protein
MLSLVAVVQYGCQMFVVSGKEGKRRGVMWIS